MLLMSRGLLSSSSDNADYDIPQCLGLNLGGIDSWNWSELLRLWQAANAAWLRPDNAVSHKRLHPSWVCKCLHRV